MDHSESFGSFANCVIMGNNLLKGTPVHLSVDELRKTLSMNMSKFLASKLDRQKAIKHERLANIESFEDWMQKIVSFNRETTADLKCLAEIMEENNSNYVSMIFPRTLIMPLSLHLLLFITPPFQMLLINLNLILFPLVLMLSNPALSVVMRMLLLVL